MTAEEIKKLSLEELIALGEFRCSCGRTHAAGLCRAVIEQGAVDKLPALIKEAGGKKPFLLSGKASFAAAGEPRSLLKSGVRLEPDSSRLSSDSRSDPSAGSSSVR